MKQVQIETFDRFELRYQRLSVEGGPNLELRQEDGEGGAQVLVGLAAPFNVEADLGWMREIIRPGAFTKTIQENDVVALFNHDPDHILGRIANEKLELWEDDRGLRFKIHPPAESTWAKDALISIDRRDVAGMSFGFRAVRETVSGDQDSELRELLELELFDISPVTFPAYPTTEVQAQQRCAALKARGVDAVELRAMFGPELVPVPGPDPSARIWRAGILRRRLELQELELGGQSVDS